MENNNNTKQCEKYVRECLRTILNDNLDSLNRVPYSLLYEISSDSTSGLPIKYIIKMPGGECPTFVFFTRSLDKFYEYYGIDFNWMFSKKVTNNTNMEKFDV